MKVTATKDGGPAFPFAPTDHSNATNLAKGMSLRDYFAGQALAGICAHFDNRGLTPENMGRVAYEAADAMIAAQGVN